MANSDNHNLEYRVTVLEEKFTGFVENRKAEKETIDRVNAHTETQLTTINQHLQRQDRLIWISVGIAGVIQTVGVPLLLAWLLKKGP